MNRRNLFKALSIVFTPILGGVRAACDVLLIYLASDCYQRQLDQERIKRLVAPVADELLADFRLVAERFRRDARAPEWGGSWHIDGVEIRPFEVHGYPYKRA
jgi:hypothetical protein